MTLTELLPLLKPYRAVLVTGPQRSGTAIATKIIAEELGYREVPEEEFGIHAPNKAYEIMAGGNVVLHGPGLCDVAHEFDKRMNCAVVMMRRDLNDIHASEERIGWRTAYDGWNLKMEQMKYGKVWGRTSDDIAALKYEIWDTLQKDKCVSFDLDYETLREHPLWRDERAAFAPRQTA